MPAAIGPLGPLLADPARARSEPVQSGGGSAFAKILETEGRSDQASPEKDGEHADGAGSAAVLAFSAQPHPSAEDTATGDDPADTEQVSEASDLIAVVPAPKTTAAAAPTSEAEAERAASIADERGQNEARPENAVKPAGDVKVDDVAVKNADSLEIPTTLRPAVEAKPEGNIAQADARPTNASRPTPNSDILSAKPVSDRPARATVVDQNIANEFLPGDAAAERAESSASEPSKVAELKADKAAISDTMINARAKIKGSEAPGRPDLVLASLNPGAHLSESATGRLKDVPATAAPATVGPALIDPEAAPQTERGNMQPAITTSQLAAETTTQSSAFLNGGLELSAQASGSGDSGQQAPVLSVAAGAPASAPVAAQAPVAGATGFGGMMTPAQATIVAAPQEIVDIVSNKLAGGDKPDRIMVQLDPPELGRVSIEFKFDAQGLQQVAVRADTPEAMKQLRLLHFDLVQSLEQHGLSARDMTFSEGSANGSQNQQPSEFIDYTAVADNEAESMPAPALLQTRRAPITIGASGLNIKL